MSLSNDFTYGWVADNIVWNNIERWSVSDDGPQGGVQGGTE